MFERLENFTNKISDLPDKTGMQFTAAEIKAYFDSQPEELRVTLNKLIDELKASTASSQLGVSAIEGVTGSTIQAVLEGLKSVDDANYEYLLSQIQYAILGQIPDGAVTPAKLSTDAKKATTITVADSRFTNKNVEGALGELFQYANDGKTSIANVVGSPTVSSDTFSKMTSDIQTQKNNLATNLTNKGQSAAGTETLKSLVDKVANVNTGKRFAKGTATGSSGMITVTGLSFKPSMVMVVYERFNFGNYYVSAILDNTVIGGTGVNLVSLANQNVFTNDNSLAKLNSNGFEVPVAQNALHYWVAYE